IDFVKIRKLLAAYKIKLFGKRTRWVEVGLVGKTLTIAAGTKNKTVDKDDAWWYALAQSYDVIYDIGANVGYASILATLKLPAKQIVLADPNPAALEIARANLERNNMGNNKHYINAFVGEQRGQQVKFY